MNAWRDELDGLRVRSVALPRDGGVLNPDTAKRYSLYRATDVAKTIKRERARLAALAAAAPATALPHPIVTLLPRSRP